MGCRGKMAGNGFPRVLRHSPTTQHVYFESMKIYFGTNATGTPIYTEERDSLKGYTNYEPKDYCLSYGDYYAVLGFANPTKWDDNSKLIIRQNGQIVVVLAWACHDTNECGVHFSIDPPFSWQYSSTPQSDDSWRTKTLDWPSYTNDFPQPTTVTRYFRRSAQMNKNKNYGIYIRLTTDAGAVVYVNGKELVRWNMPAGKITPSTQGFSSDVVTHKFVQLLAALPTPKDDSYMIAVELHAGKTIPEIEHFNCSVMFLYSDYRLIDSDGSNECTDENLEDPSKKCSNLFDDDYKTEWSVLWNDYKFPTSHIWRFGNNDRMIVNKYYIANTNHETLLTCYSWTISASNDGQLWEILDNKPWYKWGADPYGYFEFFNQVAYNQYKFTCYDANNWVDYKSYYHTLADWDLVISNSPYIPTNFSYPQIAYNWTVGIDHVNISCSKNGFTNWQIVGENGASLPHGLTFNLFNGSISGIPTSSFEETVFTVSALYSMDNQIYTCTLNITVIGCDFPSLIAISVEKTNYNSQFEKWEIRNSVGEVVLASNRSKQIQGNFISLGDYTVTLSMNSLNPWKEDSVMTITAIADTHLFVVTKARKFNKTDLSFTISLSFPLLPASDNTFKYLADGTVPSGWYTSTFSDSAWNTLDASNRPTTSKTIQLFRSTFTVASKEGAQGFELYLKARNGVLAYLNGEEIYRSYLEGGDITADSVATGGTDDYSWRRITGAIHRINVGSNIIAVAVITSSQSAAITIAFDMHLRLLKDSHLFPRYFDFSTSGTAPSQTHLLFDMNPSTEIQVSKKAVPNQEFIIEFANSGAELYNKYCFVTNTRNKKYDPRDWTIKGSMDGVTYSDLKYESEAYFDLRRAEFCFYMPTNTQAWTYYKLVLAKAYTESDDTYYGLSDWNLYLEDYSSIELPELSFSPNELIGYTGAEITNITCSSPFYSTFSIQPELPGGLVFSKTSGKVHGKPTDGFTRTMFTITALTLLGEEKTTTISLSVEECSGNLVLFSIDAVIGSSPWTNSLELRDRNTGEIVDQYETTKNEVPISLLKCRPATKYILVLKDSGGGWDKECYATVKLADGRPLLSGSVSRKEEEKEYAFNPVYSVYPQWAYWHYLVDGSAAPSGWNTLSGAPSSWKSARARSFPTARGVTQYYYTKFQITDLSEYASMDITVTVRAGVVVYLNGEEICRYNLPEETSLDVDTAATAENDEPFKLIVGETLQRGRVVVGENILAFELHRFEENEKVNSFDASAILVMYSTYMMVGGVGKTNPKGDGIYYTSNLFDNHKHTEMVTEKGICEGVEITWTWDNNRREPITGYGVAAGEHCNNRHPSGWILYGSNDGGNWTMLHTTEKQYFTNPFEEKIYRIFNFIPFNQYRMVITECNNTDSKKSCDNKGTVKRFQLSEFYLFTMYYNSTEFCRPEGDFYGAMNGEVVYAACPALYEGIRSRLCKNGTFLEEIDDCYAACPKSIDYGATAFELKRNRKVSIVPTIIGAEVTVDSFPPMPDGLSLVASTGAIVGKPTTIQELTNYTIIVMNEGGNVTTTISIQIKKAPFIDIDVNVALVLYVLLALCILIAIGLVFYKYSRKGKKAVPKKANSVYDAKSEEKQAKIEVTKMEKK